MPAPRLLIVVNNPVFFVSHRLPVASEARRRGYDVHIATPAGLGIDAIEAAGLTWHEVAMDRASLGPITNLAIIRRLAKLYRQLAPSIVHHVTPKPVVLGTIAARIAGVPSVLNAVSGLGYLFTDSAHGGWRMWLGRIAYRLALRHPGMRIILQNVDDVATFEESRLAPPESLVLIRGSGVDTDEFRPAGAPPTPPVILQTGRCLRDKGVAEFLAAAPVVRSRHPYAIMRLAGDIDPGNPTSFERGEFAALAAQAGVDWLGPRDDVKELLQQTSIFCLASYREGLPKSLIEAAAAGLPLVATDVPGCREVVRHGVNGLLVEPRNADALADAISALLDNPETAATFGRASRMIAEQEFALPFVVERHMSLYAELTPAAHMDR